MLRNEMIVIMIMNMARLLDRIYVVSINSVPSFFSLFLLALKESVRLKKANLFFFFSLIFSDIIH